MEHDYITSIITSYLKNLEKVKENGANLQFVDFQTNELCLAAIENIDSATYYVKKQTPEICLYVVTKNSYNLIYIKNPSYEITKLALQKNGFLILYIKYKYFDQLLADGVVEEYQRNLVIDRLTLN